MAQAVVTLTAPTAVPVNKVKIEGNVGDAGKNPVARTVQIYDAGTSDLRDEVVSDATTGDFISIIPGTTIEELRVEAHADEAVGDENTQIHDYVNPVQYSKLV